MTHNRRSKPIRITGAEEALLDLIRNAARRNEESNGFAEVNLAELEKSFGMRSGFRPSQTLRTLLDRGLIYTGSSAKRFEWVAEVQKKGVATVALSRKARENPWVVEAR